MYCKSILLSLLLLGLFSATPAVKDLEALGLKILQDGKEFSIKTNQRKLTLSKEKFTVFFNLEKDDDIAEKYFAARLVADIDPEIFTQFETNKSFEEIPALSLGTSMAGPQDAPYECIFFDDQAHHYIFYNSEEEKRAHLISSEDGLLQVSFDIENYCMQDLEVNIKDSNFEEMYLVFVFDKNLNEKVEEGELVKLEIEFEK